MAIIPALDNARQRFHSTLGVIPDPLILVTIATQTLSLISNHRILHTYPISSAAAGVGNREGSFQTPLGIHKISHKIGEGAPERTIFKDRISIGRTATAQERGENLILSRILRLQGLEPGVNQGPGIDSFERYIYIHGTNHEHRIGTPNSHGCVCMKNSDIIHLFDSVSEGTIVFINE
jgi:lipoprotein-anchoring transpeptidase ErfK/SrfK